MDSKTFSRNVRSNDIDKVKEAIKRGFNVNSRDPAGWTALHEARSAEMTQILLDAGANPNCALKSGATPLHFAGRCVEQVKILLKHGARANTTNDEGETPLHSAKTIEVAEALLSAGADINDADKTGRDVLTRWRRNNMDLYNWYI